MALEVLVPGGRGQLGTELAAQANGQVAVWAPNSAELDVTRVGAVVDAVAELATRARGHGAVPLVLNAAAYTAVDAAESDEDTAFAVNVDGPRVLAAACASHRIPLVHVSTDYVFAGTAQRPYEPDETLAPRTAYGRTKAAGEDAVLGSGARAWVVRTAWVYAVTGANFVNTMLRLESEHNTVSVVDDQFGSPTFTADLAAGLIELAGQIADGAGPARHVLHCTGAGQTNWAGFAKAIFTRAGADPERVRPCATAEVPRPAPRPAYSVLSNDSWCESGLAPLRSWEEGLDAFFARRAELAAGPSR